MDWRRRSESASLIERTTQLIQEAKDLQQSRSSLHVGEDDLVSRSRQRIAISRNLLARPVWHPFKTRGPFRTGPSGVHARFNSPNR